MLMGWFIAPAARAAGPAGGPFMQALLKKRVTIVLVVSGIITVGAGLWLWAMREPSMDRWQGQALAIGATSAIVALIIGIGWQRPTGAKVKALGAQIASGGGPPTAEQGAAMGQLQTKMSRLGSTIAYLLALALAGMALGGS